MPTVLYNPFWPHVKMAWKNKDHPNMHFLFYEDLKTDVMKELRTLNEFLGTRLTQQQLDNVSLLNFVWLLSRVVIMVQENVLCYYMLFYMTLDFISV